MPAPKGRAGLTISAELKRMAAMTGCPIHLVSGPSRSDTPGRAFFRLAGPFPVRQVYSIRNLRTVNRVVGIFCGFIIRMLSRILPIDPPQRVRSVRTRRATEGSMGRKKMKTEEKIDIRL